MFERIFQLLPGHFQNHERVFVNVKPGDVAHGNRPFGNTRFRIEDSSHGHLSFAGFHLHSLNQIQNCGVAEARLRRRQFGSAFANWARQPALRLAIVGLAKFQNFRIGGDAIIHRNRAGRARAMRQPCPGWAACSKYKSTRAR